MHKIYIIIKVIISFFHWWINLLQPLKKLVHAFYSHQISAPVPYFPSSSLWIHLLHAESPLSFFFFPLLCTNRIPKYLTINLIFHMLPLSGAKKEKGESLFHVASKCFFFFFFGTKRKCNEVSKLLVSGVSFPKQVSRPPCSPPFLLACVADLASAPLGAVGAHTGWKNRPGH